MQENSEWIWIQQLRDWQMLVVCVVGWHDEPSRGPSVCAVPTGSCSTPLWNCWAVAPAADDALSASHHDASLRNIPEASLTEKLRTNLAKTYDKIPGRSTWFAKNFKKQPKKNLGQNFKIKLGRHYRWLRKNVKVYILYTHTGSHKTAFVD